MTLTIWRCSECGQALGVVTADEYCIIHRGLEVVGKLPTHRRCPNPACRAENERKPAKVLTS